MIKQVGTAPKRQSFSSADSGSSSYGSAGYGSAGYGSSGKGSSSYGSSNYGSSGNSYSSAAAKRSTPGNKGNFFTGNPYISKGISAPSGASSSDYEVGDTVKHVKFGTGKVLEKIAKGDDFEVTIEFEGFGTRKLRSSFAKLEKI